MRAALRQIKADSEGEHAYSKQTSRTLCGRNAFHCQKDYERLTLQFEIVTSTIISLA